ncbi:MAG: YHS domain-containing protein [Candidatus Thorarchaeota archaeon]
MGTDKGNNRRVYMSLKIGETLCGSCVAALTSSLLQHRGVLKASINPTSRILVIDYDSKLIKAASLERIIQFAVIENNTIHRSHINVSEDQQYHKHRSFNELDDITAVDPVCHMTVRTDTAKLTSDYKGTGYYFCSKSCKDAFDRDSESYLPSGHRM